MIALQYTVELWLLTRRVPVPQLTCGLDGSVRYCCLWSTAMSPSRTVVESQCGVLLALQTQRLSYIHETWKTAATKTLVLCFFWVLPTFIVSMMPELFHVGKRDPETNLLKPTSKTDLWNIVTNFCSNVFITVICRCFRYPLFVVSTMVLFVFSDLGLGTVVNIVFFAGEDVTTIGPAFSFSVMTLSRDSLKGGRAHEKDSM